MWVICGQMTVWHGAEEVDRVVLEIPAMRLTIDSIRRFLERAGLCMRVPNQATMEAMNAADNVVGLNRYDSFADLRGRI